MYATRKSWSSGGSAGVTARGHECQMKCSALAGESTEPRRTAPLSVHSLRDGNNITHSFTRMIVLEIGLAGLILFCVGFQSLRARHTRRAKRRHAPFPPPPPHPNAVKTVLFRLIHVPPRANKRTWILPDESFPSPYDDIIHREALARASRPHGHTRRGGAGNQ